MPSGRKPGVPNKSTLRAGEIIERCGANPIQGMCAIAMRMVPCGTCIDKDRKPTGRTFYKLPDGQHAKECAAPIGECTCEGISTRVCESCFGTLWERISVDTMLKANAELARYRHPQLTALHVTDDTGRALVERALIKAIWEARDRQLGTPPPALLESAEDQAN